MKKMEAIVRFEKENALSLSSKTNQGLFAQTKRSLKVHNGKNLTVPKPQALRKVLGNLNKQVEPKKSAAAKAKKINLPKQRSEEYPAIETFIPYNPLDYESFEVPEEHKLGDVCLAGISLFIARDDAIRFDALTSPGLYPMENREINYDCFEMSIPLYEDINVGFPLLCDF
ncbi:securin-like [Bufo bufo]|uniref:securin-like n=1 Tax=Bufo bufo TaxID=8384 RepID=UPI001ABDECA8|nr:securin-like [Bufo bufo]